MTEQRSQTNGAEKSSESGARFPQHLTEAGRQIQGDARQLVTHVSEAGGELQSYISQTARERPLTILAVAAGVGYVLGGGLSSRLTVLALGVGTRFAMAMAAREMGSWAMQGSGQGEQRQGRGQQQRGGRSESGGGQHTQH
jgi:ElaB/YqjD/DUF883 family membrane-anchored ribosome-binding protein